ncbi:HPr-rel-A system PqqD family peptide chaperone [Massilia sp. PWRC2]|uniref:HPr-rel-A system PqqD family peptide chaperone n=1 Tax=Massilia sp. PWRC2 TaxID=2804626 RepID=UPI003CF47CCF
MPARRWRLRPGQQVLRRQWGDECVVFNNLSGDCHLLDANGYDVLVCLQNSAEPMDTAALASRFNLDDADEVDALERVLAGLAGCELIEALA